MRCSAIVAVVVMFVALFCAKPMSADVRPEPAITPFENRLDGLILTVRLSARNVGAPDIDLRFMLDTGAGVNVLDVSVPPDYFWEEPDGAAGGLTTVIDANHREFEAPLVHLKRLEIGGMTKDDQPAIRMDLKRGAPGAGQDEPIDGVLGMSFLRGTSFVIDPVRNEIRWWQTFDGHRVPLGYDPSGSPAMLANVSGTDVWFTLDTGSSWGFQAPGRADDGATSQVTTLVSALGHVTQARVVTAGRIAAGGQAWIDEPLVMVAPGEGSPIVGRKVLLAGLLGLDFSRNTATFQPGADGNLQSLPAPSGPRFGLGLAWDRREAEPRLTVGSLAPDSPMEKAGFKQGDELVRVGPLRDQELTIAAVTALVEQGEALPWVVLRDGRKLRLRFPTPATMP